MRGLAIVGAAALLWAGTAAAQPAGLVTSGEAAFKQLGCSNCHLPDDNEQAPPLAGVYGRKIAGAPNWPYCDGLKAKSGTWTDANLDAFLSDTKAFTGGCVMDFKISDPAGRGALIAYLKTLK